MGRLSLVACEAFDNYPPGVPGRLAQLSAKSPITTYLMAQSLRLRPMRRAPMSWGWMSKRPVLREIMDEWFQPLMTNSDVRRDFRKYAAQVPDKATLLEWAERQRAFDPAAVDVAMNGIWVCRDGGAGPAEPRDKVDLSGRDVTVTIDLKAGRAEATILTTDLTHDYVHENSAYST